MDQVIVLFSTPETMKHQKHRKNSGIFAAQTSTLEDYLRKDPEQRKAADESGKLGKQDGNLCWFLIKRFFLGCF